MIEIKEIKEKKEIYDTLEELEKEYASHTHEVSLKQLSNKIADHGKTLRIDVDNHLAGCCSFYCNDKVSKTGYITKIAIKKEYRRLSLGQKIITEAEKICKENKMNKMKLEVSNENIPAIKLYTKCGYIFTDVASNESKYMEKPISRKK